MKNIDITELAELQTKYHYILLNKEDAKIKKDNTIVFNNIKIMEYFKNVPVMIYRQTKSGYEQLRINEYSNSPRIHYIGIIIIFFQNTKEYSNYKLRFGK